MPDPEAEAREEEWMKTYREEKEPEAAELQGVPKNGVRRRWHRFCLSISATFSSRRSAFR